MKYLFLLFVVSCMANEPQSETLLFIDNALHDCVGVSPQKCMKVRFGADEEWTFFYDQIEGFTYEEGYNYTLSVRTFSVDNPPADASSKRYVLDRVISKEPASDHGDLNGKWRVMKIGEQQSLAQTPDFHFNVSEKKVTGSAGCNNYHGEIELKSNELTFGTMATTRKLCSDMSVENLFLATLKKVAYYKVVKSELYLYNANDELLILALSVKN